MLVLLYWAALYDLRGGSLIPSTEEGEDEDFCCELYLQLTAVTLLSLLHVAIAALQSSIKHLDLWHVVQTHAHTFLQTACKVLLAAGAKYRWEGIPTRWKEKQRKKTTEILSL